MKLEKIIKIIGKSSGCYHYITDGRQFIATELAVYEITGMATLDKKSITMLTGKDIDYQIQYTLPAVCEINQAEEEQLYTFKTVHTINGKEVFCTDNDVIMVNAEYFRPFCDDKQYTYTLAHIGDAKIAIVREGVFFCGAVIARERDYADDLQKISELLKANGREG